MKYCMKCGVSVDEEKNRLCPLCDTIILSDEEIENLSFKEIKIIKETKKKQKKIKVVKEKKDKMGVATFVVFLSSFVSILILLIVDLAIGWNIDWSIIPIISLVSFILTVILPFMKLNKPIYWYITVDTIVLSIYFLLLNYVISKEISWSYYVVLSLLLIWNYLSSIYLNKIKGFVLKISKDFVATAIFVLLVTIRFDTNSGFSKLALPINALVFILTVISYLFIKTYRYNWRVIISTISINTGILCLGIDLLIQNYLHNKFFLQWSYIVLFVLIPFTLYIMYLDNRFKIHNYITKKFHI